MSKRYIITCSDNNVDRSKAASILNVSQAQLQDGVSLLATDAILSQSDTIYFPEIGNISATLSSSEAEQIKSDPRVVAVEEDKEMYIFDEIADQWDTRLQTANTEPPSSQTLFQQGYEKGITDLYNRFVEGAKGLYVGRPGALENDNIGAPGLPALAQPIPWNIKMVNAPQAWARGYRGSGVKVAVLDTGIAAHGDLVISGGASFVPGVSSYHDGHGHGTHCAGVIGARQNSIGVVGVAPLASLYAVKVLSDQGRGNTTWILAGMAWAKQWGMHVVSMSLGSESCQSVAYTNAIAQLNAAGITVVCAAGNSGRPGNAFRCVGSPANSRGAVAVAAVDSNKQRADFSSFGTTCCPPGANPVSLSAPGVNIKSTVPGGYSSMNGTSMACPHVAGAAALVKQRFPGISPAQIKTKLMQTATDLGPAGADHYYGAGLLNCEKAVL